MRDVFYLGKKPNVHPREKFAKSIHHARQQCTTEHFWIINEFCDYKGFDWDFEFHFLPDEDVWAEAHNNVWPSQWQKDSGTWLCPEEHSDVIIYRADVTPIKRKNEITEKWVFKDKVDTASFDFSWHPDSSEPPYIYVFGNQYYSSIDMPTLEYHTDGATEYKFITDIACTLAPKPELFELLDDVVDFDYTWRPDPHSPPYIYVWGCEQHPATIYPVVKFVVSGATEYKFIEDVKAKLAQKPELFETLHPVKDFDYSWRPDPTEPPYIYVWGNQWYPGTVMPTVRYVVSGATEIKHIDNNVAILAPDSSRFEIIEKIDDFDFSWVPDPTSPPYIYVFGNQWYDGTIMPTIEYHCGGATDRKYVTDVIAKLAVMPRIFDVLQPVESFDFSWRPNPKDPPYNYVFGNTQYPGTVMPTVQYRMANATDTKYVTEIVAELAQQPNKFEVLESIESFDYSWVPDPTSPPYIYVWGNQWHSPEKKASVVYKMHGATEHKYMSERLTRKPDMANWSIPIYIHSEKFDFSWEPDPTSPPYIYEFSTQWQKTGGPKYNVPGATEVKYEDSLKSHARPSNFQNWEFPRPVDLGSFDFSWHPDGTEEPFIYQFGTQHQKTGGPRYVVPGATVVKYIDTHRAKALALKENWVIPSDFNQNKFDFSWHPDDTEQPYVYAWGNKWVPSTIQPTITYVVAGGTELKHVHNEVEVEPQLDKWKEIQSVDKNSFDLSWRPDPTSPPYIYVWGNKHIPAELQSTIEYHVDGATERKYMTNDVAVLPELERWKEIQLVDKMKFDLTWRPDPREPAFIYVWGNKHIPAELKPTLTYTVPGGTEYKYMSDDVDVIPELDKWKEIQPIDKSKFDLSWRPDPREPAFIYVWGNKHIPGELKSTIEYHCDGATEKKYIQEPAEVLPDPNWKVTQEPLDFDYTWRPDPREPAFIYVWGNKYVPAEIVPTIEYYCEGATERKYMGEIDVAPEWDRYQILIPVDKDSFDFTWRPDPREPSYIYVWGNQYNRGEVEPTIEYHVPGATERQYMSDKVAKTLPVLEKWKTLIPIESFDYTWRPDPGSPPYIYVFGNQWHDAMTEPTVEYHVNEATEYKFITDINATVAKTQEHWKVLLPVTGFDFSWRPNPHSRPYIYVFGNQWNPIELEHTVEYHQPGATDVKYITDITAYLKSTNTDPKWKRLIPIESFDYSWRPDPREPALIYVFGNKWNDSTTEPSVEYHMEGATERKYMSSPVATPQSQLEFWSISNNDDLKTFDFSWRPNPHSPAQIYQWADNGPRYTVPGATEVVYVERTEESTKAIVNRYKIETTLEDLINQHPEEVFWAINPDLSYDKFDFSWRPNEENFRHINVFGNEYSKNTQTYYVNGPMYMMGHREYNYVEELTVSVDSNLSMFYIDRGNRESQQRFDTLKIRYPQIQKTRYLNTWVDTINRCINKSGTKLFWVLNSELDYNNFEFDFYPSQWQMKMVHVFGTQWSHWGNTYMINKETFANDTKYVKIIEHLTMLNFVKSKKATATNCLYDIIVIDHGNDYNNDIKGLPVTKIPFDSSYLKTFKNMLSTLPTKNEHYVWVCSSICDYGNFDFTYICDPYAKEQLHVFPSDRQKFGDTFLVDVNKLRTLILDMTRLEDYEKVNYNPHQRVQRLPAPTIVVEDDTHCDITKYEFDFPYADFVTTDNKLLPNNNSDIPMSIWAPDHRNIVIKSTGGTKITAPKDIKDYVSYELYDYPYISRSERLVDSRPLDIVFLSNGETGVEENYEHLLDVTSSLPNRVVRVDGVNGRVQAYHAAATASETPWMFTVFAKLRVNPRFDFTWQPDRLQVAKHYIFNATNPVNGLEYGHQAMIAYNKKIVLGNQGTGLDFTLDNEHEVVDMNSGVAMFNTDEWSTWRTAFREAIKLRASTSDDSKYRLDAWLTKGEGPFAQYSINGALDAVEYYESVNGDLDKLRLSYDWPWLQEYFNTKYN